jgi:hypothetical protein
MHTVELLEAALETAKECGILVRQEWLGGAPSGSCEFKGRRWLIVDLALSPAEQLATVLAALRELPKAPELANKPELQSLLRSKRAA